MSPTKIIAIVGATGTQGSSVANTFLTLPNWRVRCLTRNPSSAKAQELASRGAEVVPVDLADRASLDRAFEGAAAIFVNTDFWAPYAAALKQGKENAEASRIGYDTEVLHAKNATDAAAAVPTLERFIFSALGPMTAASGGKYNHSYHWETKATAADYIEQTPQLVGKASFFYPAIYHTNPFLSPQKYEKTNGDYALLLPGPGSTILEVHETPVSTGPFVRCLIEDEEPGVKLLAYDQAVTALEAVETWNKVTGKSAKFLQVTISEMAEASGVSPEVLDGAAFLSEFSYMHGVSGKVIKPDDLKNKPALKSYEEILRGRSEKDLLEASFPKF
jgi:hypothetical protein